MVPCDKNVNHAPFYTASLGLELTDSYSKRFFMNLKKYLEIPKTNKIITSLKHTELMLKQNSLPKSTASLNQQGTNNSCHPSGPNLAPRLSYRTSSSQGNAGGLPESLGIFSASRVRYIIIHGIAT
jgi:hypothetical protein